VLAPGLAREATTINPITSKPREVPAGKNLAKILKIILVGIE